MTYENNTAMVAVLENLIKADIPGFSIKSKDGSRLMRIYGVLTRLFNPSFLTTYTTTVYPHVYFPRNTLRSPEAVWRILAHEWIHLRAMKRLTPAFFTFLYLVPASLAPLALLAIGALGGDLLWLVNLLWLLLLAPLPAYFRMREEWSGYRMTLAVEYWMLGNVTSYRINNITEQFCGSAYWYMWPFKQTIRRNLYHEVAEIKKGVYDQLPPYNHVRVAINTVWKTLPKRLIA